MKNLKLWWEQSMILDLSSKNKLVLLSTVDVERNILFFASSVGHVYSIQLQHSPEKVGLPEPLDMRVNFLSLEDGDFITSFFYLMERESLLIGTDKGHLLLHSGYNGTTEFVGHINGGVRSISLSPDGDILAIMTGLGKILVMTLDWDVLYEALLDDEVSEHVGADVRESDNVSDYCAESPISWRGDGKYFCTLGRVGRVGSLKKSKLRVWERDCGILHASSEHKMFVNSALDWMPNGSKIASVYDRDAEGKPQLVVLFERNCLERSSFCMNDDFTNGMFEITCLKWNCGSELLAALVKCGRHHSVKIWFFSNNHWYLKQEIRYFKEEEVRFMWDPVKPLRLICWTISGKVTIRHFVWVSAISQHNSTALVIDGPKLLVTPLLEVLMPPPMCLFTLRFQAPIREFAFYAEKSINRLVVFLSDGCVGVAEFDPHDGWDRLEDKEFQVEACVSEILSLTHLTCLDSNTFIAVSPRFISRNTNSPQITQHCYKFEEYYLQEIKIVVSEDHVPPSGPMTCSGWLVKMVHEITLLRLPIGIIVGSSTEGCVALIQFEEGEIFTYYSTPGSNPGLKKSEDMSLQASCPWTMTASAAELGRVGSLKLFLFGLDLSGKLHCSGRTVCTNCVSFSLYSSCPDKVVTHLIIITKRDELFVVNIGNILNGNFYSKSTNFLHSSDREHLNNSLPVWERGAKIVGMLHGDKAAILIQTSRGSLECVYPRELVLASIVRALDQKRFKDALLMVRRHRIDFNIIVDYRGLMDFVDSALDFVQQVGNLNHVTEFVRAIKNENVIDTQYRSYFPDSNYVKETDCVKNDQVQCTKVSSVLFAVRKALLEKAPKCPAMEFCVLTTLAKSDPPALEEALERIKSIRESELMGTLNGSIHPSAEDAVKHLLWLSQAESVYNAALGIYDLNLAAMVAQNSQKDPREFVPFLEELEKMSDSVMRYTIDLKLQRYSSALKNAVAEGDGFYKKCLNLLRDHPQLFPLGLKLITEPGKRADVFEAWGDHLYGQKCFEDAAETYLCCSGLEKAMKAYRANGNWRGVLTVAGLRGFGEDDVLRLSHELCEEVEALGNPKEAAQIAIEYCGSVSTGVGLLIGARDWEEALRVVFLKRDDGLLTTVKNAVVECAESVVLEYQDSLEKLEKYLARFLAVRQRRLLLVKKVQSDSPSVSDVDYDSGFETRSDFSGMSAYIMSSSSKRSIGGFTTCTKSSVKTRDSRRKKNKARIRAGSPGEEAALEEQVKGMGVREEARREMRSLISALLRIGEEGRGRRVQETVVRFQKSQMAAAKVVDESLSNDEIGDAPSHSLLHLYHHHFPNPHPHFSWTFNIFLSPSTS